MEKRLVVIMLVLLSNIVFAQTKYLDRSGEVSFFSEAPLENIEAKSKKAASILDIKTGEFVVFVLMKTLEFEKALMQEHFNEKYVESDKYPKAIFKGEVINVNQIDFSKPGKHTVQVSGTITLHGVTRPLKTEGDIILDKDNIRTEATFYLAAKDFDIEIPKLVIRNIAPSVKVTVKFKYQRGEL